MKKVEEISRLLLKEGGYKSGGETVIYADHAGVDFIDSISHSRTGGVTVTRALLGNEEAVDELKEEFQRYLLTII